MTVQEVVPTHMGQVLPREAEAIFDALDKTFVVLKLRQVNSSVKVPPYTFIKGRRRLKCFRTPPE